MVLAIKRAEGGGPDFLYCGQFGETAQEGPGPRVGQIVTGQRQGLREIALEHAGQLVGRPGALIHGTAAR